MRVKSKNQEPVFRIYSLQMYIQKVRGEILELGSQFLNFF